MRPGLWLKWGRGIKVRQQCSDATASVAQGSSLIPRGGAPSLSPVGRECQAGT